MIVALSVRYRKHIAALLFSVFYLELYASAHARYSEWEQNNRYAGAHWSVAASAEMPETAPIAASRPSPALRVSRLTSPVSRFTPPLQPDSAASGGPTQPEMSAFSPVNANNMVDLFSGDFSYNIPLLDVGGYPVNIAYHSGVSMDEEASWVGLGWNINPGSITRNMRGLPDDFNGGADTIRKVASVKPNVSWGVNVGADVELTGLPLTVGAGLGLFHTTYTGWGFETSINASINGASKSGGSLTGGLSLTNNSQSGVTINPSVSAGFKVHNATNNGGAAFGMSIAAPYNSRTGLKSISMGLNANPLVKNKTLQSAIDATSKVNISFSWPTYSPSISMPLTNYNFSFTAKAGFEAFTLHPDLYISGYGGKEYVAAADTSIALPAFGYLNYQNAGGNYASLLDFNREKEMPYREKPAIPHIAVPSYTYDAFSVSGEGTGGMFRAYRGDIGYIYDHLSRSKTISGALSIDFGGGNLVHGGVDLNANYSVTQAGPWISENTLQRTIGFQHDNGLFQAAYFRNPGEKAINTNDFYNAIGGDDVVAATLSQNGNSSPTITATNTLNRYSNKQLVGSVNLDPAASLRNTRDKRSQVISYLTAKEASEVGLDKYIYRYGINQFGLRYCDNAAPEDAAGAGSGLLGYYFKNQSLAGTPYTTRLDTIIAFNWGKGSPMAYFPSDHFSIRWLGRIKAPESGTYTIGTFSDDGVRLWINDSLVINNWTIHGNTLDTCHVTLEKGELYNVRMEYFENGGDTWSFLAWKKPSDKPGRLQGPDHIPKQFLYPPVFTDTAAVNPIVTREDRVNNFRKASHISEMDVLNADGRRYVYGIPVYNLIQKEVSFNVTGSGSNLQTGLTSYTAQENSTHNTDGKDGYYSREEIPAYAHSFLLTGILSPDYVDVTGDGISDDDIGDAVRFNYSKASGIGNPFGWRAPYVTGLANYNEGLKTYNRDDKANYIYGTKELWYLHTIESKTMIATFTLQSRQDLLEIDEAGNKTNSGKAMCLKQIDLYSKADFMQRGTSATPVKTVHFEYSYELCRGINSPVNDSGKLTLKKIWFTYNGNNKGQKNPYIFHYSNNNPRYATNMSDKWGTYKDPAQNPASTTGNIVNNAEYPYSLQDSTLAAYNAGAWMLDSIGLPSGGRIKVNYESDDYAYVQNRRATEMCRIVGFGQNPGSYNSKLYDGGDQTYVFVRVPVKPSSPQDLYARYLDGMTKIYFRLFVHMPSDDFGSGSEYVPCYASPDIGAGNWYGIMNDSTIWIKIKSVNKTGDGDGSLSPLAQTSINFLRLNLPSKAYPGSEVNDNLNVRDAVMIMVSQISNMVDLLLGFDNKARILGWARDANDLGRSLVRLDCPNLKKLGGGSRVKSVMIYDNWNAMTQKRETVYGQTYDYTTTQTVNGVSTNVSSGVAVWEPSIGGEENPFHLPIEYVDRASMLAPAATLYTEEPLGESFYPGPSVGYSKVRVRSLHSSQARSANGYAETKFYTSYDFPVSWDWSMLDNDTKKRFKPILSSFLRINARNFMSLSQGFKVELNDMNGKMRSEATYSETDPNNPISLTENFYRVDNQQLQVKHLNNVVAAVDTKGNIDTAATIGKDVELMADMRDETSTSIGGNINVNIDLFAAGIFPIIVPSLLNLYQKETTRFRSVGMTKVIYRFGILDSVVHVEKGSKIISKNLLYNAETGDPLLVRTQNEYNDSLYEFSYPSHWVYNGMAPAYTNIDALLPHLTLRAGKIVAGLRQPDSVYLAAGDELLVYSKASVNDSNCTGSHATFANDFKLWVVDTNLLHNGPQTLFMVDKNGTPFSGYDVTIKVIRSGHRNMNSTVGSISSLGSPLVKDNLGNYHLVFDSTTRVLTAAANELRQYWQVGDKRRTDIQASCVYTQQDSALAATEGCSCIKPLFDYLLASHQLFRTRIFPKTVGQLVDEANAHGYPVTLGGCPILSANASLPYYTLSASPFSSLYMARLGSEVIDFRSVSGFPMSIYNMTSSSCQPDGSILYKNPGLVVPKPDTVTVSLYPDFSTSLISSNGYCPGVADTLLTVDSSSDRLITENNFNINGYARNAVSVLRFGSLRSLPQGAQLLSAQLILQADQRGHVPGQWPNANSVNPIDSMGYSLSGFAGWFPYQFLDTILYQAYFSPWYAGVKNSVPFQNDSVDVLSYVSGYLNSVYYSNTFVVAQGAGPLHVNPDSTNVKTGPIPPFFSGGYGNAYATFYSQRYADPSKWPAIRVTYIVPAPPVDTLGALLEFNSTINCTTIVGRSCYSAVTDTLVNPYQYGILGNYRNDRAYVYYGRRTESNTAQPVNLRTGGTIKGFMPFWTLQSGRWHPSYDTTRWVWNTRTTLFNRKGFELENTDPLGRYNAGLYGYGLTLPTAVIQNGRYQEAAFEGFEDYGYTPNSCDTLCAETRPFDFSPYITSMTTAQAHTGLYSLLVPQSSAISMTIPISAAPDSTLPRLLDSTNNDPCTSGQRLNGIHATPNTILPPLSPFAGKRMLVGAWVKEDNSCACRSYTRNHILLRFAQGGDTSLLTLSPSGNLLEGWQRYEAMVDIPANATSLSLILQASDSATTYFDDIRIQPYNAEMKSYVYNAVNLRMMAELDENNYATFFEYDDDGTLIRVKKETERGIQTIKETRSALLKDQ